MASPVGHALMGLAAGRGISRPGQRQLGWYAFAIVAGNAADLDFLPGILIDQPFAFHRGPTHSLAAALAFGLLVYLACARRLRRPWRAAAIGGAAYATHLALDMPHIPLFWPLWSEPPAIAWPSLPLSLPWAKDGGAMAAMDVLLSAELLYVLAIETAVYLPILAAVWLATWARRGQVLARAVKRSDA